MTTGGSPSGDNPVIDFTKTLKFDIYTDKALKVALGCRETTNAVGTPIGSNGGTTGTIDWVGATNKLGTGPTPSKTVTAGSWQTLSFNIPKEPTTNFTGDGVLYTASGLGVLEHLAFVPAAGNSAYNVYLDNFIIPTPNTLTYSLGPGFPEGASVNPNTGVFTWTPTEAQGGNVYNITVRVTDSSTPPLSSTKSFAVTVLKTNSAPVLAPIANFNLHAGSTLTFTNSASDPDIPADILSFSMTSAPAGASIDPNSGIFSWTPLDSQANTTNTIQIIVTDSGTPTLSNSKNFSIAVAPRPTLQSTLVNGGTFTFNWSAISGKKYRIQFKEDLTTFTWTDLIDITATDSTVSFSESAGSAQRFYRIIDLD